MAPPPAWQGLEIPNAPPPHESSVRRLSQMKQIVERFRSSEDDRYNGRTSPMRILPQPIYPYLEPTREVDGERAAKFPQVIRTMQAFTIKGREELDEELTLVLPPALRYSDSVSSDIFPGIPDGAVFVWTRNGHPEALTAMHIGASGQIWAEFLSIAPNPLVAARHGQAIWSP